MRAELCPLPFFSSSPISESATLNMNKLTQLDLVTKNQIIMLIKERFISGMRGIRKLEIKKPLFGNNSPPASARTMLTTCNSNALCPSATFIHVFMCCRSLRRTPGTRLATFGAFNTNLKYFRSEHKNLVESVTL
ncbi:hypothetical protein CIPAW_07G070700 [Carya illinoinensis]|uniref:Uncharacterized protein n=1 Tax=Carya illinoinensis TaxID=32201 RepID=A0A8T1PZS5_CARIL|nr:hypothetical protein CIPAW_07G070700 [Carya illinoinensis]